MIETIKSIFTLLITTYLIVLFLLFFFQSYLIFPAAYNDISFSEPLPKEIEEITLKTQDGILLNGAMRKQGSNTLLIYFGGNYENAKYFVKKSEIITGVDIAGINYRGYAKSEGSPSQKELYADSLGIYDHFADKYEHIIVAGRSLGSAVATYMGSKRDTDGLFLISPFDSVSNIAKKIYPIFPINLLLRHKFDSISYAEDINLPISILMVKDDKIIPNEHTLNLKNSFKNIIDFQVVENTGHNELMGDKRFFDFIKTNIETVKEQNDK